MKPFNERGPLLMPFEGVQFGSAAGGNWWEYYSLTDDHGMLGRVKWNDAGTKCYKFVKVLNTATVAIAPGALAGYQKAANSGYVNSLVSFDTSADCDAVPVPAGCATISLAGTAGTAYYLWIQIKGVVTLDTAVSSGAAGTEFLLSTTDKTPTVRLDASLAKAAGIGINTTTLAILDCPF